MAIERRLTEIAGPVGGKLHTARSRNDQVATDVAMLVRAHSLEAKELLQRLMATLVSLAERHMDWRLPGYTHLQRAQPVYLSHHLLAYFWKFRRDLQRFNFCMTATDDLPLGAGALAGVNFDTSRMFVAQELGFGGIAENSLDAVSNRDFVLDYLSAAATCATHLSQLGAEIVLWSTQEFGFCEVSDAFASGSSLMPQKKNPDAAELLRAKAPRRGRAPGGAPRRAARPAAHLQQGPPGGQGAAVRRGRHARAVPPRGGRDARGHRVQPRARWRRRPPTSSSPPPTWPTCSCGAGVPFREAHGIVGGLVRAAVERGKRLSELTEEELRELAPQLDGAVLRAARRGLVARVEGVRRRHRAWRACATSSPRRGRCCARRGGVRLGRGLLRPLGARRGARPDRLRGPPRRDGRPDRRDRELPHGGAGLPRLRGRHRAHAARCSARPAARTSTSRTASTRC